MKTTVQLHHIWISSGHDFRGQHPNGRLNHGITEKDSINCVAGQGIEGDRYFNHKENFKGQITFFSEQIAQQLEEAINVPGYDRSEMRRNVLISGIDLNSLIGKRFRLGGIEFSGSEECAPCYWMESAVGPGAHEWLKGNGGLRCRIETSGQLTTGDFELEVL